jgi:hypothetical protein
MKRLAHLQKKKYIWYLIGICTLFALLRIPSFIEPDWYGDEGIYQVIGQALHNHSLLYRDIWDNKPPLLYLLYALVNGGLASMKILSLVFGIGTVIIFFFLCRTLLNKLSTSIIVTTAFALLLSTPLLEGNIANAENFTLLLTTIAALLFFNKCYQKHLTIAQSRLSLILIGFVLGIGFLFKTVVVFDFVGFSFFLFSIELSHKSAREHIKKTIHNWFQKIFYFLLGFLMPFFMSIVFFLVSHDLSYYMQATFFGNIAYVGYENELFGFPQGFLLLKIILLFFCLIFILKKYRSFSKSALFIITWFLFSLFNIFFSGRHYTHYLLNLLPSFCLLIGLTLKTTSKKKRMLFLASLIATIVIVMSQFSFNVKKTLLYYPNAYAFVTGSKTVSDYQRFFDAMTPRDYALANFISNNTTTSDKVFIWGDHPQIYYLSQKTPISQYTVSYHIIQKGQDAFEETQNAIEIQKPKYIIALQEAPPLPFSLPLYIMKFNVEGADIYERSF